MLPLFSYPKSKHQRSQFPPVFKDYRRYKPHLQKEFAGQCVYCRAFDRIKGLEGFGVDHYRPKSIFLNLECEYLNLFYCCNRCNSLKSSFWPTPNQVAVGEFIPNPCEHVMFSHMRSRDGVVLAASNAGAMTIEMLDLNDPVGVGLRKSLIEVIDGYALQIKKGKQTIIDIQRRIASTSEEKYVVGLAQAERSLESLFQTLEGLVGPIER